MEPDSPFADPVSSFQFPIAPLDVDPDAAPLENVQVNSSWLALLRGCAKQLLQQTTWRTSDPDVLDLAQQRAFLLISLLTDTGVPMAFLPGMIMLWGAADPPSGWLLCNGNSVSKTAFPDLFAAIGYTFGGTSPSNNFNVPDLMGRVPVGVGAGSGLTSRALAAKGGEETHVLSSGEMPSHTHRGRLGPLTGVFAGTGFVTSDGTYTAAQVNENTGGGGAHNTMQPFTVITYIIKAG
jgi:microcystin-dependent protein